MTYTEAKAAGARFYDGKLCSNGHTRRYTKTSGCVHCPKPAPTVKDMPVNVERRLSLAGLHRAECPACGPSALHHRGQCVTCGHDGTPAKSRIKRLPRGITILGAAATAARRQRMALPTYHGRTAK